MNKSKKTAAGVYMVIPYILLVIVAIVSVFPLLWVFFAATHTNTQIYQTGMAFALGGNIVENYKNLMEFSNIWRNLANSIFIAVVYTVLVCLIDSMAGFAFAKFTFKGRDTLFFVLTCSMFIPQQVTLVPLFIQLSGMGLINTLPAVILPSLTNIFGVFLMRQNLMAYPSDLLESARIDGAGDLRVFFTIVLPTMKPALASLAILSFVQMWGNYLWPLIALNDRDNFTVPLVLALMRAPGQVVDNGAIMLGASMALLPVVVFFLFFQKNFIQGILSGAVKG
ncbi:MAG: carbohydrate ABC transporter permease [Ruminococcaceae bacterium]|nr:carbohydrate ABC transporter permease [Oscillospiraceae bacterium]